MSWQGKEGRRGEGELVPQAGSGLARRPNSRDVGDSTASVIILSNS